MFRKKICRAASTAAVCIGALLAMSSAVSADTLVYEATMKCGNDVFGTGSKVTFYNAKLDFNTGAVQVFNRLVDDAAGETAYALPKNGESFRFSYITDPADGHTSVAINGEIVAEGICKEGIGRTGLYSNKLWGAEKITVSDKGQKTKKAQSAKLVSCDSAAVTAEFENPIPYSKLSEIGIYDADGKRIETVDYIKDNKKVIFKTKTELSVGSTYFLRGENISDIYGDAGSFELSFSPAQKGVTAKGSDVALSADVSRAWDFERRIDWHEEANLTKDNGWRIGETVIGNDDSIEFYKRLYAMPVTNEHKSTGDYALRWDNHPYYSTVATEHTAKDWTGANMFNIWIYSEKATGETVTILVYSDNPDTPWKDGYTYPIKIDWEGERQLSIPLEAFSKFENPAGFNNVSAIYFTTKIFNGEPNPYTVLYLDNLSVTYSPEYPITPAPGVRKEKENQHRALAFDYERLNHAYPEVAKNAATPFLYEAYYKTERALYGYFPKYNPGVASFDKDGKTYIRGDGTHIQYLENGKWEVIDLLPTVRKVIPKGTLQVYDVGYEDPVIRFDNDGWAYVLVNVDAQSVLCWSSDGMKTWQATMLKQIDANSARFEHIDGGNTEAMNRPPLILLHAPAWSSDRGGYLVVPKKTADGGLELNCVKYAESCISTAAHTGDGNFVVSKGDTAYVIYGIYEYSKLTNPEEKIPEEHEANNMSYTRDGVQLYFKNGEPTFVKTVNLTDMSVSEPVFVGFGGVEDDDHNWPGISIDKNGYLHIIINGHHDPFCYTSSKKPYDITEWNSLEQVGTFNSYGAMLIDNDNNVHVVTRDASRGYRFDISVSTRNAAGTWEKSYVAQRVSPYYEVARQRMSYNPVYNEFYMHYYSQSDYFEVFKDEYDGALFTWPNEERCMRITTINGGYNVIPKGTDRTENDDSIKKKCFWEIQDAAIGREGVLVKSADGAKTFKLVETGDCK